MEAFFGFLKIVVICFTVIIVLFLILLALPKSPVRDFTFALTKRLAATAAGAVVFLPVDIIPVGGEIVDLLIVIGLAVYWIRFFMNPLDRPKEARRVVNAQTASPYIEGKILDASEFESEEQQQPYRLRQRN
jgi:hypothetical protein